MLALVTFRRVACRLAMSALASFRFRCVVMLRAVRAVNSLFIADCERAYAVFRCSQCRSQYKMAGFVLKKLFADHVPSHRETLDSVDGSSRYVMANTPCERACYDCEESGLTVLEL